MNSRNLALVAFAAALGSAAALAQSTLGDLLDAGAVKLSKDEVVATLSGAKVSGPRPDGGSLETDFKADGTYTGSFQGPAGSMGAARGGGFFGKWAVDDTGKMCTQGSAGAATATATCAYFFRSGDKYYASFSDKNRAALVLSRTVKR